MKDFESLIAHTFNCENNKVWHTCEYCECGQSTYNDHLNSDKHIANMLKISSQDFELKYTDRSKYNFNGVYCKLCYRSVLRYAQHCEGSLHQAKLRAAYEEFKKSIYERQLKLLKNENNTLRKEKDNYASELLLRSMNKFNLEKENSAYKKKIKELEEKIMTLDKENLILKKKSDLFTIDEKKITEYFKSMENAK